ncbi:hypothetical protein ACGF0J_36115 [Nonomuraea sp. NPDC047897]|uniref:hypothetical protein n=1 Tax=Nonomuraea sp. NPDC047897 TaxID=3364346 RepID=UPI00371EB56F
MTRTTPSIGRVTAAIVAIAAMLPYLTLKILWMAGNPLGLDQAFVDDPTVVALNAMTFGMDAVGLVMALAFAMRWGMRVPAWLVLLPLWVGMGLLSVIVVTTPLSVLVEGADILPATGPIQPWVFMVVYSGFVVQGVGLMVSFALYARDRWPHVLTASVADRPLTATLPFQVVVARGALLVTLLVGGTRLAWAFGVTAGLPGGVADAYSTSSAFLDGVKGLLAIGAGAALPAMVAGAGRAAFWKPLVVAWLGTGAMFGWGLYAMIVTVTGGPLGGDSPGLVGVVQLFETLTGLVMGMCGAFLLAERSRRAAGGSGGGHVQAAQHPLEREDREGDRAPADHGHG